MNTPPTARLALTVLLACLCSVELARPQARAASSPRVPGLIQSENARPGTTDWVLTRVEAVAGEKRDDRYRRQRTIEGYISHTSLRAGEELTAFVGTDPAARFGVEVFRMGYYGGKGARLVARRMVGR